MTQPIDWTGVREISDRARKTPGHPMNPDTEKRMPQTTTQRTAKHRLAVKERMARYEAALLWIYENSDEAEIIVRAQEALSGSECNANSGNPTQRG